MEQGNRRWIIRNASGQIDGPFTTEKILYKIGRGEFLGDESIAHYPDGKWIPISQDPQFYDKLLEVLAENQREDGDQETRVLEFTRPQGETVAPPPPADGEAETSPNEGQGGDPRVVPIERQRSKRKRRKLEDIELVDTRKQVWKEVLRRAKMPVMLVASGVALASVLYVTTVPNEERIHLIGPQKGVTQSAPETLKGRIRQGVGEFLGDTYDGYIRSENDFVYVVEHNNKNAEVMALLCMTYLELWPYAHQDSADTKVIGMLVQMSSGVDPAGMHSATCRAVDLIVRARFQEAKSLVEAMLDARANESTPPIIFYYLKGSLLEGINDHQAAIGYLQSAEKLWPQWMLPYVTEGQALTKIEKYGDAANLFRRVLKVNPNHTVARIELGLLEYKYFNHYDIAEQYLSQGLDNEGAPRSTLSRGYFGLAEIALKRGEQKKALKFAQKAFSLNSSNTTAKNLIVQLGGVEKLKDTKVKGQQLLFEGDQFSREGDCHAAQAHYKAAFEQDPRNAYAALKAAQCLWKLSFSTEAMEWLNRAIRADPKLMEAYVTLADYQAQRYNFLAAARTLDAARNVNPKSHEVFRGFAMVELKRGNAQGAINFGKQALQLYENDVETQILLAQASLALKDYKMAYNYAAKAVEIDVNHRKAQIVYAEALAGLQGVDVGVDYYLKLVNNYPLVTEYRLALGKMLLADERYQQAEEIFRQIIKLDEKPKEADIELAKVLRAQGSQGEALDLLLKAAVLDPADAEPLYLAGTIYLDLKKPMEASVQFKRVLTINKSFPLVHYQLGRAALMMNDAHEALNQTDAEKRQNPNLADAYLLAADAHSLMGQYSNCASEYQKAIKLRPQQAYIYVKNAQCYRKSGNLDAASAMLNVASIKESGLADIYKEQGAIYEMKGDFNHAIEAYNQYFVLDPDAPDKSQIEERITSLQRGQSP
jgi:tetratricopeptide (TPR) repeat protein